MFSIFRGEGFQITFANGYTVSVQFGAIHNCNNRNPTRVNPRPRHPEFHDCVDAEVAVIRPDGSFVRLSKFDDPIGWQTPAEVAHIITVASGTNPEALAVTPFEPEDIE